ncbi:MAG: hypothetical protein RQ899_10340 [Pseudomonadales bacterium]|nr:hypothetical protein [Pseudomonadales bacterium]
MAKLIRNGFFFILVSLCSVSALAEKNISGVWRNTYAEDWPDRLPGPELADYAGLPLNDGDRLRAQTWDASLIALPEYQCRVHPSDYANSFADIRIWEERDPYSEQLIALRLQHFAWQTRRTIWMDGREHPPEYAQHSSMGFSTGTWDGQILTVKTTHLKEGWLRRNGVARSDLATVTEHFIRHGDVLTWTVIVDDPIYLEEPFIRSRDYEYSIDNQIPPYTCESVIEMVRERGYIPHHLPGTNPDLHIYSDRHDIPFDAAMGGAKTMYPEYMNVLRELPRPSELKD